MQVPQVQEAEFEAGGFIPAAVQSNPAFGTAEVPASADFVLGLEASQAMHLGALSSLEIMQVPHVQVPALPVWGLRPAAAQLKPVAGFIATGGEEVLAVANVCVEGVNALTVVFVVA